MRHYVEEFPEEFYINAQVMCYINSERRLLNSRYHTAAHLIANIEEFLYPKLKAIKSHSFPNQAYVEFEGIEMVDDISFRAAVYAAITENHTIAVSQQNSDIACPSFSGDKNRTIQIGSMSAIPCGGTHLSYLNELGAVSIYKIKTKNSITRVSYEVA